MESVSAAELQELFPAVWRLFGSTCSDQKIADALDAAGLDEAATIAALNASIALLCALATPRHYRCCTSALPALRLRRSAPMLL